MGAVRREGNNPRIKPLHKISSRKIKTVGWVAPRVGFEAMEKRKILPLKRIKDCMSSLGLALH
jgi:hypothetical protein